MKKKTSQRRRRVLSETLRPEYDFRGGKRGATVARYRESADVVVIDPDVLDVFPDADAVNAALRALAAVVRRARRPRAKRRSA
jgi:hypothetical protein